ncbi:SpoIIE family protein phosphatase [Asanoa sp. NPDC049573]|uniref:PP2C family protein-serine/threonine phosphatase n=1 Tax=Asanoa sp. NPDC049573 TaxID=3155396 RepID=UPI003436C24A
MTAARTPDDRYDDDAPCGSLVTTLDGTVVRANATLLRWIGLRRDEVVGQLRFSDLLNVGGRIYYETHLAPLLRMQGEIAGVALELRVAGGARLPVLVTAVVLTDPGGGPAQIRVIVFDARERRSYEQELLRAREAADRDRDRLTHLVRSLQQSLLPAALPVPPGTQTAAYYHMASAEEVGGDFYDLFPLPGNRWGFLLGDVCGKGVEAAAVTAMARYTIRASAFHDPDPAAAVGSLNSVLYQEHRSPTHRHCTVVCGVFAVGEGGVEVTMATGGHPPPLLLRGDGTADYLPATGGPLVGVLADARYYAQTLTLRPGDTLLLYTDGLTEARAPGTRRRYGPDELLAYAAGVAPATASSAVAAVQALLGSFDGGLDDDVAVMAIGALATVQSGP